MREEIRLNAYRSKYDLARAIVMDPQGEYLRIP